MSIETLARVVRAREALADGDSELVAALLADLEIDLATEEVSGGSE